MTGAIRLLILFVVFLPTLSSADDLYEMALKKYRKGEFLEARALLIKKESIKKESIKKESIKKESIKKESIKKESIKKESMDAGDYNLLGWISLKISRPEEAINYFQRSLELAPELADSFCGLGFAYYYRQDFKRAVEYFNKGLEIKKDHNDCLEGRRLAERFFFDKNEKKAKRIEFFARGDYFWKLEDGGEPELFFIRGVNLGFGIPGRFPVEFPDDEAVYLEWFKLISDMGANLIRVYTVLPPEFYRALKRHNEEIEHKLFLIQGIWVELPKDSDFRNKEFLEEVKKEIRNAVDVIHGKAEIEHRYGHAYGVYRTDVSEYVLGFIFGREWEPFEVIAFNSKSEGGSFDGRFLSIKDGSAFEVWLTEMLDYLINYETEKYSAQRPVAFMNWPTLDPLHHESEATFSEEIEIRRRLGEGISLKDFNLAGIFDDDAVSIDENKIIVNPAFRAGIFASYHVYPFYPDFLRNESAYEAQIFPEAIRYYNYLRDLKSHYKEMPLLISEFGLSTSRAIARFHPEGFHHGGLSEDEQAEGLKRLFNAIKESRAAGGILFAWIDEWFKTNWMTREYEENDPLWYNAEDPEEGFGLMAMLPRKLAQKFDNTYKWNEASKLYDGVGKILKALSADSDEGYLYLKLELKKFDDQTAYLIAIDTYGDGEGDHLLPFNLGISSPVGFEFVILVEGKKGTILVDDYYARTVYDPSLLRYKGMSGYREAHDFRLVDNRNGKFVDILIVHRRKFGRDGRVFPEKIYNASHLKEGRDLFIYPEEKSIELRIPWGLLGFSDPSKKRIVFSKKERRKTEGIRFLVVAFNRKSDNITEGATILDMLPDKLEDLKFYKWEEWETPAYVMRPKKAYYIMKEVFRNSVNPEINLHLPEGFDFLSVIKAHYQTIDDFLKMYKPGGKNKDFYGEGLSFLIKGLINRTPFYIYEAKRYFSFINKNSRGREAEIAGYGVRYIDNLLSGRYERSTENVKIDRIKIIKDKPETKTFKKMIIGKSFIEIKEGTKIATQVDRVTRDWLSGFNHSVSPWQFSKDLVVPWHEGKKIFEIINLADVSVKPVWGTIVRRIGNLWYAPDERGIYRFPVSEDKILNYPGNFVIGNDTVVINDTHGINAIAWDSPGADLVIGCGDREGKIEAAYHLALMGINVYMPTDRFLPLLIGVKTKGVIIGSAPIKKIDKGIVIGGQPVTIDVDEPVVVSNSNSGYPVQYYDTPYRYFKELESYIGKPLRIFTVDIKKEGEGVLVVREAEKRDVKVIGVRVRTKEEYESVASWLKKDRKNRAILFHSAVYEEGYRLFFEFPEQTSFGDIDIELE